MYVIRFSTNIWISIRTCKVKYYGGAARYQVATSWPQIRCSLGPPCVKIPTDATQQGSHNYEEIVEATSGNRWNYDPNRQIEGNARRKYLGNIKTMFFPAHGRAMQTLQLTNKIHTVKQSQQTSRKFASSTSLWGNQPVFTDAIMRLYIWLISCAAVYIKISGIDEKGWISKNNII